ncbi:hypothetical protein LUZ63_018710 [Rhynchospora breviuscula]|uniref:Uncharacterized protein n=1 Tax=Rhynchospora breviuscula TaxID=2022672 RepID=A0A9Q0C535_9POAL|nr:hypothetical protein LUZ63_018710 [Rhynchospora breviuscula]
MAMASLSPLRPTLQPHLNQHSLSRLYPFSLHHSRRPSLLCKAKEDPTTTTSSSPLSLGIAVSGLVASPVIAYSLYTLKTTGCGLPPGPGGSLGALEGVSYLIVAGIVVWSIVTKVRTGSGLPAGPYGLLGGAEGLAYLTLAAIVVVFGLQIYETGSLPGPLPSEQCFG